MLFGYRATPIIGYRLFEILGTSGYDYYHMNDLGNLSPTFYVVWLQGYSYYWLQAFEILGTSGATPIIGYRPFEILGTSGYDYYPMDDLGNLVTYILCCLVTGLLLLLATDPLRYWAPQGTITTTWMT
ncbi:hypothetical protein J6590_017485 [Homalodisca vitripennis]|nr:hypothetical protein J6590_017485 [Homalodisca vitripennis]